MQKQKSSSSSPSSARQTITSQKSKGSFFGERYRSNVPPWIASLKEEGAFVSSAEESQKKKDATNCALCRSNLSLEIMGNKKMCRSCTVITCRLCAAHVHFAGHIRRRYVCLKCIGTATMQSGLLDINVNAAAANDNNNASSSSPPGIPGVITLKQSSDSNITLNAESSANNNDASPEEEKGWKDSAISLIYGWLSWNEEDTNKQVREEEKNNASDSEEAEEKIQEQEDEQMLNATINDSHEFDGDSMESQMLSALARNNQVSAAIFTNACCEMIKLMTGLGKVFEFAASDMKAKLFIMTKRTREFSVEQKVDINSVTIQALVLKEIKEKKTHLGKKQQGASRTVLRLLWFLDFVAFLLRQLNLYPDKDLKLVISEAYEETLAPRHPWVLKRVVRSGMGFVPNKQYFIPKLKLENLTPAQQQEKLKRWSDSIFKVKQVLWEFMIENKVEELP